MPVVDEDDVPEIFMRVGVTGKWLTGRGHGAANLGLLRNWVEPGVSIPRHLHDYEEVALVERGEIWLEIDGEHHQARPGRAVIIPPRAAHAWGTLKEAAQVLFIWPVPDPFSAGNSTYFEGAPPAVE